MQEQAVRRSRNYKFARRHLVSSEYFKNRPFGRFFDFVGKGARLRGEGGVRPPKYFARTKICIRKQRVDLTNEKIGLYLLCWVITKGVGNDS